MPIAATAASVKPSLSLRGQATRDNEQGQVGDCENHSSGKDALPSVLHKHPSSDLAA